MNRIGTSPENTINYDPVTRERRNIRMMYERVGPRGERVFRWPPHFHPDLEVVSAPPGVSGVVLIGGKRHEIHEGSFLAIPPMSIHSFDLSMAGEVQTIIIQFDTTHLVSELRRVSGCTAQQITDSINNVRIDHHEQAEILHGMLVHLSMESPGRDASEAPGLLIQAGANDLAVVHRVIAHLLSTGLQANRIIYDFEIRDVVEYISANFLNNLYIDDIARNCGLSRATLFRRFKKHCGMTILEYVNFLKVQHAQMLMEHKGKNVSEACYASGYESLAHFSRIFTRFVGLPPKKWSLSSGVKGR